MLQSRSASSALSSTPARGLIVGTFDLRDTVAAVARGAGTGTASAGIGIALVIVGTLSNAGIASIGTGPVTTSVGALSRDSAEGLARFGSGVARDASAAGTVLRALAF